MSEPTFNVFICNCSKGKCIHEERQQHADCTFRLMDRNWGSMDVAGFFMWEMNQKMQGRAERSVVMEIAFQTTRMCTAADILMLILLLKEKHNTVWALEVREIDLSSPSSFKRVFSC